MSGNARALDAQLLDALQSGLLAPLRLRVVRDQSLCLELRGSEIHIYYRGGRLVNVARRGERYTASFDANYLADASHALARTDLVADTDVAAWIGAIPHLKEAMDLWLGAHPKGEREAQQHILRDNNFGAVARASDCYVIDIEYAVDEGRFDFIAVHWPSTPAGRKQAEHRRLMLGEVKFGDGALTGTAGLHAHITAVNNYLARSGKLAALKEDMVRVFNQKRALGLIDCGKDLISFSDEAPMLLLVLTNHDPDTSNLRELLRTLPPSPHAELRIATASLFGYGLFDPAILTVAEAFERFGPCI